LDDVDYPDEAVDERPWHISGHDRKLTKGLLRPGAAVCMFKRSGGRSIDELMAVEPVEPVSPWLGPSAAEIARVAGASDMFVFRRVENRRFAHVGGVGRGRGWAGIVEVGVDEEQLIRTALADQAVTHVAGTRPRHIFGPYYANAAAIVRVNADLVVVFGSVEDSIAAVPDSDLLELASFAGQALTEVEPAKRLADELETLNAIRDLLQAPAGTLAETLQWLADHAVSALSCELGVVCLPEHDQHAVRDRRDKPDLDAEQLSAALHTLALRQQFPLCVQEATSDELPHPFHSTDGVLAYYLLEIERPSPGFLLLLHTTSAPARGFTLLCQSLGAKLVEAAEPLLGAALLRDTMQQQLEEASAQARRDPLTGLANRLAWTEAIAAAAPTADAPISIIQVDCRGLKKINESYGHHVGDSTLQRVAQILTGSVRQHDLVARLGGDEFGILLHGATEPTAEAIVRQIMRSLTGDAERAATDIALAIGYATTYDDNLEATQQQADQRMLHAKRAA
jgi:diguanylate cyclase (GGDEF)-like protein